MTGCLATDTPLIRCTLSAPFLASIALVWSYGFHVMRGFEGGLRAVVLTLFLVGVGVLYRHLRWTIELSRSDLAVLLGILAFNVLIHPGLLDPLGGDELYHSELSAFLLMKARTYVLALPPTTLEGTRQSMWNLFDPQHMTVVDLWQIFALILLCLGTLLALLWRVLRPRLSGRARLGFLGVGYLLVLALGGYLATGVSLHPPLQLLPLFVGHLFLGLNAFAFRLPALLTVSGIAFAIFRVVSSSAPAAPLWWRILPAVASCCIPIVVYVGDAVEPSIYGYAAAVSSLLLCWRYVRERNPQRLVEAGLIVGVLSLARHTAFVWWAPIGLFAIARLRPFSIRQMVSILFPGLFLLPYLYNAHLLGHAAVDGAEGPLLQRLLNAVTSGHALMSVVNTLTPPWTVVFCATLLTAVARAPWRESVLFFAAIPAFCVFHSIWPYLWGLGRYQAEYVAPFLVYAMVLVAVHGLRPHLQRVAGLLLLPVMAGTIHTLALVPLDTSYAQWPRMRISTTAAFPYDQALRYLKRREAHGAFVLLGGSPWYGDIVLWFAGLSFDDVRAWHARQDSFLASLDTLADRDHVVALARSLDIRYFVVQSGTRREMQHRTPSVQRVIDLVESVPLRQRSPFVRIAQFHAPRGGEIEIYRLKEP